LACTNVTNHGPSNVIHFDSGFSLCQDTVYVNIKGEMTHALKYQDKYYLIFEQIVLKYGGVGKRWLYIFSNGKVEKVIDCPKKMDAVYFDFYVKNDSIILKQYMDKRCYYFDIIESTWTEINQMDDLIYEDEKFYVYSLNFGEWGGLTWFKDKKTGLEYMIEAITPLVNKIDTTYYLTYVFTKPFYILKIEDPLKLKKCDTILTYENIETGGEYYCWYGEERSFDVVFNDTISSYPYLLEDKFFFVSSFVWQNQLFHVYETDTAVYIAIVNNNAIKLVQKISNNLHFYNRYYSYRCRNIGDNNPLLKFRTEDEQKFGLMEISENKIFINYFVNKAELSPKSIGSTKADSIFVNRLNLILSDIETLKLKNVEWAENRWGTFDITPKDRYIGVRGWNSHIYTLDTCISYLIQEDSIVSNTIMYFATENNLVKFVSFEWKEETYRYSNFEDLSKDALKRKSFFLENIITQKMGKCIENKNDKVWKTSNGLTIELGSSPNFDRIELIIYKE